MCGCFWNFFIVRMVQQSSGGVVSPEDLATCSGSTSSVAGGTSGTSLNTVLLQMFEQLKTNGTARLLVGEAIVCHLTTYPYQVRPPNLHV